MRWNASHRYEPTPAPEMPVEWPDLHVCPACDRPFVVVGSVLDVLGPDRYLVDLGCRSCGWHEASVEGEARLEALDREHGRQVADIREEAELMELTRRVDEIAAFARALHHDLILPEDF